jgi:hypothetical protein
VNRDKLKAHNQLTGYTVKTKKYNDQQANVQSQNKDSLKMAVFWVVAPCSLVEVYSHFRGACCPHHQGDYMAQQPRRQSSSYSLPWEPEISQRLLDMNSGQIFALQKYYCQPKTGRKWMSISLHILTTQMNTDYFRDINWMWKAVMSGMFLCTAPTILILLH